MTHELTTLGITGVILVFSWFFTIILVAYSDNKFCTLIKECVYWVRYHFFLNNSVSWGISFLFGDALSLGVNNSTKTTKKCKVKSQVVFAPPFHNFVLNGKFCKTILKSDIRVATDRVYDPSYAEIHENYKKIILNRVVLWNNPFAIFKKNPTSKRWVIAWQDAQGLRHSSFCSSLDETYRFVHNLRTHYNGNLYTDIVVCGPGGSLISQQDNEGIVHWVDGHYSSNPLIIENSAYRVGANATEADVMGLGWRLNNSNVQSEQVLNHTYSVMDRMATISSSVAEEWRQQRHTFGHLINEDIPNEFSEDRSDRIEAGQYNEREMSLIPEGVTPILEGGAIPRRESLEERVLSTASPLPSSPAPPVWIISWGISSNSSLRSYRDFLSREQAVRFGEIQSLVYTDVAVHSPNGSVIGLFANRVNESVPPANPDVAVADSPVNPVQALTECDSILVRQILRKIEKEAQDQDISEIDNFNLFTE
jgi:hypothetical protein